MNDFDLLHQHTAHCETGVISTLLKAQQIDLNEAMIFGLAQGLTFAYFPFIKVSGMPLISYRMPPGSIIKQIQRILKLNLIRQRFRDPIKGQQQLDRLLAENRLVGLQTSVFWLPYFPPEMRFHFNAHNLLVYAKQGNEYLISDPVFEQPQRCHEDDLQRARFAKGALAGKGLLYYLEPIKNPCLQHLPLLIEKAIYKNAKQMLAPIPFIGIKGMNKLAKTIAGLATSTQPEKYKKLFLGHVVRMQEEIGTGGAGFRYIYAYFLQQSASICESSLLQSASQQMTNIGDQWRQFANLCVAQCKKDNVDGYAQLATKLEKIALQEKNLWLQLKQWKAS